MFFYAVVAVCGFGYAAGRQGDTSLRDPVTFLVFLGWLVSFMTVLFLHDFERRRAVDVATRVTNQRPK